MEIKDKQLLSSTIIIYQPNYYHYSGRSIEEFWRTWKGNLYCQQLLDGTLTETELDSLTEDLLCDAECGALWNYVEIGKSINLDASLKKATNVLETEDYSWEPDDKIEDIISVYCYYKLGKYEVFSLQLDSTECYKCVRARLNEK